ncbi:uncharacterized protein MELLADRAFT_111741 [Melampsora larici-populina 98AG31]|uniref:Uncharacterized protein n=1 Tax=Melampsora larici-populina (strain 98AG31 / pathotype 3-4-7) TaxID=747676 RepID=F4S4D8_MELLP|nr:uncharacterized protein MELLADRAFT_111741 [Melampsora larici-populina 98AG31]EGG00577.1 hypothetical protein MELLADRAFT_111741 [Melampsora larici-populina 98AG31]
MITDNVYVSVPAQRLSKKSYMLWRTRTQALLDAKDVLGVVTDTAVPTIENAPTESDDQILTKDRKAYDIIIEQLHELDRQTVISNPALQSSARTLWLHFYRRYGVANPLQVDEAWTQFHECRTNLEDPNLMVNIRAAISKLEAAGQATDISPCRTLILSMFPTSLQPLKNRLSQEEAILEEVLAHLETVIQTYREPVSPLLGSADPARKDSDKANPSQKVSEHNQKREMRIARRINRLPSRSKKRKCFKPACPASTPSPTPISKCLPSLGQIPTPGPSNPFKEASTLGTSSAANQNPEHLPHVEPQPHNISSLSDTPSKSKHAETSKCGKISQGDVDAPGMPSQTSSFDIPGPSAARNSPSHSGEDVGACPKVLDTQKDVKPEIQKDAAPEIQKEATPDIQNDEKNDTQKEVKPDIKKEFEPNLTNEDSSRVNQVYEEQVSSSCAAQNPFNSSHLRTKKNQKPTIFDPTTSSPENAKPVNSSTCHERQVDHNQTSQNDTQGPQTGKPEERNSFDPHARQKTNKVYEYHRPSAPYIEPGSTEYKKWDKEYLRYILQNRLPRLVVHWNIGKDGLLDLFKKHYIEGEPVDVQSRRQYHYFYNNCKRGDVPVIPGRKRQRDPWRAAIQLLNPTKVLDFDKKIDDLIDIYEEEGGCPNLARRNRSHYMAY